MNDLAIFFVCLNIDIAMIVLKNEERFRSAFSRFCLPRLFQRMTCADNALHDAKIFKSTIFLE